MLKLHSSSRDAIRAFFACLYSGLAVSKVRKTSFSKFLVDTLKLLHIKQTIKKSSQNQYPCERSHNMLADFDYSKGNGNKDPKN